MQTGGDEAGLKVRFAGDRGDKQQNWWPVAIGDDGEVARSETYRRILDALDHKRQVLGELAPDDGELKCRALRTGSGDRSL